MKNLFIAFTIVLLSVASSSFAEEKSPNLTLVWPDGTKYVGGVADGKRNGDGTIYWTDGTKFIGHFENDLRNGPGSMILPDGTVHSGYFVNDKLVDLPQSSAQQTTEQQAAERGLPTEKPAGSETADSEIQSVTGEQPSGKPVSPERETIESEEQVALVEPTQQVVQHVPVILLTDTVRNALTYTIDLWAAAWSMQNTELYLDIYHDEFKVPSKLTRRQWEMLRKSRLTKPRSIDVNVAYDRFEIIRPDIAEVTFKQTYKSNLYRDVTTKMLTLVNTKDGWKILSERTD